MSSEQPNGEKLIASGTAASMTRDESHGLQTGASEIGPKTVVRDDMATQGHHQARESSDPMEAVQNTMQKEDDDEEEEDPLIVAQREQEEKQRALEEAADVAPSDDPAMKVSEVELWLLGLPNAGISWFAFNA